VNITLTVETSLKGINEQVDGDVCRFTYQGKEIICARLVHCTEQQIRLVIEKSDSIHAIGSTDNNKIWHHCYGFLSKRTLNMTQKHVHSKLGKLLENLGTRHFWGRVGPRIRSSCNF
jgi:hypothetical protein